LSENDSKTKAVHDKKLHLKYTGIYVKKYRDVARVSISINVMGSRTYA